MEEEEEEIEEEMEEMEEEMEEEEEEEEMEEEEEEEEMEEEEEEERLKLISVTKFSRNPEELKPVLMASLNPCYYRRKSHTNYTKKRLHADIVYPGSNIIIIVISDYCPRLLLYQAVHTFDSVGSDKE
ncbi:hypothetical protein Pmani_006014 [Petrolisthes manimaculis]|uniref:Uncharacterized protein n=1 Tax=Petrolisthes manimaculis TaxID=1843537 RepID=A0AAE1QAM8_9EUCA|nr:hypothetical protein Pmani_006014 [Petrolisthes manimaculis]